MQISIPPNDLRCARGRFNHETAFQVGSVTVDDNAIRLHPRRGTNPMSIIAQDRGSLIELLEQVLFGLKEGIA